MVPYHFSNFRMPVVGHCGLEQFFDTFAPAALLALALMMLLAAVVAGRSVILTILSGISEDWTAFLGPPILSFILTTHSDRYW
ncbi:hypothetical protein FISHEDRAFT_73131 [Fistulina hepatica ATCC 64428]|uniref:Uncharacterized protein n=1 Tax=Fistulina hepatica ATCC 64428 TaxID=1128425 RepID=A0A0D7ADK6_9AGAR|nr:hypothetical protein FISHEDRAFT_73131 [Fistulina hepatica ATCC 64428]